ncbi:MAG: hypothetical protein GFH27_549291n215 [Chloroflexi bacterium AL-W]|nr:hypothetical protein [Chloroflexi bacterium AL-N1]NOK67317.1 hypothetical protein [Chloroflexi bacterium AL-N10]NOK75189.1 hypothetical protein [Chloroflexi bacterium AL-N5]NOK81977.1 hypothetical protein [Chloroflexi bacterium AL-W]NOK89822.1 hypothetical protein [Chloroflexi bacterium AL-N15]
MEYTQLLSDLSALEEVRGHRVVLYFVEKSFAQEDVTTLYRCLRRIGPIDTMDLVVHSPGGSINIARKAGVLLRSYVRQLHVLIPYHARSAGALLSLAGDTIVMPPVAELGPIDPHITSSGPLPPNSPSMISAEDVRAFRAMAEEWFDLKDEEYRMEMFNILNHRIFPTTLSSFYRSDQQMRRFANELLQFHMTNAEQRKGIADQMVGGFGSHDYSILRDEARSIGLPVSDATSAEEHVLERVFDTCVSCTEQSSIDPANEQQYVRTSGIIASRDFVAQYIFPSFDTHTTSEKSINITPDTTVPSPVQLTQTYAKPEWRIQFDRKGA